jgi:glucose/arabinose dehydrogenase
MHYRVLRGPVLAATLALLATAVLAQDKPALPPGSPLIGRPANNPAAEKLAPVPAPPLAAAADKIPLDKFKLPQGFNLELYASGMPNARSLALDEKGTVFVGSRLQDKVYAISNKDGKRQVHVLASGLYRPNGVAYKDGTLYIAELSQISKIEHVEDQLDKSPKPVVIYSDLPKDEAHGWKYLAIGPDNKLYFEVGQPGNNVLHDDAHGQLRRLNLDGTGAEKIAFGIRRAAISTSPTTAATGCRRICPTTSSTASPRPVSISVSRTAIRATSPTSNSAGATAAATTSPRSR